MLCILRFKRIPASISKAIFDAPNEEAMKSMGKMEI
jgi:hypothetical protein